MSFLLRQEKKGRRTKVGIFVCVVGVALLGVGISESMRGGAELLALTPVAGASPPPSTVMAASATEP